MKSDFKDKSKHCPECGSVGHLSYYTVPESERTYIDESDGGEVTESFSPARDYECENCCCRFTLWSDDD